MDDKTRKRKTTVASTAPDPLLRASAVASLYGVSERTLWNYVAQGIVPAPIKLGGNTRWPQSRIHEDLQAKAAGVAA